MKVKAYCGLYVGAPKWQGTEAYEPDECCWEGVVEVDAQEWEEGCVSITCPACDGGLHQGYDHFEEVANGDDEVFEFEADYWATKGVVLTEVEVDDADVGAG
jgi:hypothetical protein